jgi:hypothetical protein
LGGRHTAVKPSGTAVKPSGTAVARLGLACNPVYPQEHKGLPVLFGYMRL